jgi:hypothetical protein
VVFFAVGYGSPLLLVVICWEFGEDQNEAFLKLNFWFLGNDFCFLLDLLGI